MKKSIITILTIFLLVITSCSIGGSNGSSEGAKCTGSDGVSMKFDEFSQGEVTGSKSFSAEIGVDLENIGPSLADITLDIRGIDSEDTNSIFDVSFVGDNNKFTLEPRECDQERGDGKNILIDIGVRDGLDLPSKSLETKADIALCYQYNTVFEKNVCVKGTKFRDGRSSVCDPDNQAFINDYGQGSPVVVSNVEYKTNIGREKIKHTYEVNFEKGRTKFNGNELRVFPPHSDLCEDSLPLNFDERNWKNRVNIEEVKLGLDVLECDVGEDRLFEIGRRPLKCSIELTNQDSTTRPLYIKISYEVEDTITKDNIKFDLS